MSVADAHVADLVPHSGEIVLLDQVLEVTEASLRASTTVRADGLFNVNDHDVPAFIGVEYMAQSIAAWAGWHGQRAGGAIKPGLLLGVREFSSNQANFVVGDTVQISVDRVLEMENGLAVFDGLIEGDNINITARLSVLTVDSLAEINT